MLINEFMFEDRKAKWRIDDVTFQRFNLFVGGSGVGKTKILDALQRVSSVALDKEHNLGDANGVHWSIKFSHDDILFHWEVKTTLVERSRDFDVEDGSENAPIRSPEIAFERLIADGRVIIERDQETFTLNGDKLPKLKQSESALVLLAEQTPLTVVRNAFRRFLFEERAISSEDSKVLLLMLDTKEIEQLRKKYASLAMLQERTQMPDILRAFLLQENHKAEFKKINDLFCSIFPTVVEIQIHRASDDSELERVPYKDALFFCIKERGIDRWIPHTEMSSGMRRTFIMILETTLAPPGTVVVIDEFENSLGINCMPQVTDFILGHTKNIQFVITSHHPYIINSIPISSWMVVRRNGNRIFVQSAKDIPQLSARSHHDAFTRLLNLPLFQESSV